MAVTRFFARSAGRRATVPRQARRCSSANRATLQTDHLYSQAVGIE